MGGGKSGTGSQGDRSQQHCRRGPCVLPEGSRARARPPPLGPPVHSGPAAFPTPASTRSPEPAPSTPLPGGGSPCCRVAGGPLQACAMLDFSLGPRGPSVHLPAYCPLGFWPSGRLLYRGQCPRITDSPLSNPVFFPNVVQSRGHRPGPARSPRPSSSPSGFSLLPLPVGSGRSRGGGGGVLRLQRALAWT